MTCQIHVIPSHDPLYDFLHISNEWGYYVFLRFVCFRCLQEVASTRIENLQHICTFRLPQTQQGEWTSYQIKLTQGGANLLSNKTRGSKPPIKQKQGGDLLSNIIIQASSLSTINPQHFFNKGSEPLIRQNSHKEEQTSYQTKPGGENLLTNKIRGETSYQKFSISNIIKY